MVQTSRIALKRADMKLDDIGLIEIDEAFAAPYLACEREMGRTRDIVNVSGRGTLLCHPAGCTGTRPVVTLLYGYGIMRRNVRCGLNRLYTGEGLGLDVIIERE